MEAAMSARRIVWVVLVVLSVGVPVDMLACGDKFLMVGRLTSFKRLKNVRAASVLIYANPKSATGTAIKKAKIETLLNIKHHHVTKVQTFQELSTIVTTGRFDVILTANSDVANVRNLLQTPDTSAVLGVDDLVKNDSLFDTIDKAVLQRDQNLKKPVKR
jgi:hypothetical protein